MEIRRARAKDAEEACAVVRRSISELCGADHRGHDLVLNSWLTNKTADSMRGWIARSHVFVAVDNDRIVGVGAMTRLGKMMLNYVAPEARFRGISKGIVLRLETQAASMGLGGVTLESTTTALRFYHSIGYRSDGPPTAAVGTALCHPLAKTL
jgi:GNAT superfamily N-acetyltransferase